MKHWFYHIQSQIFLHGMEGLVSEVIQSFCFFLRESHSKLIFLKWKADFVLWNAHFLKWNVDFSIWKVWKFSPPIFILPHPTSLVFSHSRSIFYAMEGQFSTSNVDFTNMKGRLSRCFRMQLSFYPSNVDFLASNVDFTTWRVDFPLHGIGRSIFPTWNAIFPIQDRPFHIQWTSLSLYQKKRPVYHELLTTKSWWSLFPDYKFLLTNNYLEPCPCKIHSPKNELPHNLHGTAELPCSVLRFFQNIFLWSVKRNHF